MLFIYAIKVGVLFVLKLLLKCSQLRLPWVLQLRLTSTWTALQQVRPTLLLGSTLVATRTWSLTSPPVLPLFPAPIRLLS